MTFKDKLGDYPLSHEEHDGAEELCAVCRLVAGITPSKRIKGSQLCATHTVVASPQLSGGHGAGVLFYCKPEASFLLLKRGPNGDRPGTWCCPGGGVENYETIEEAVRRENEEEIGLDRNADYKIQHMHRDYQSDTGYTFHNHFSVLDKEFTPILNDEHTEYQWFKDLPDNLHPGFERSLNLFKERNNGSV